MIRVELFGKTMKITAASLVAMAPHMRAECLRLIREAGHSEPQIAAAFGVGVEAVGKAVSSQHAFRLASYTPPKPEPVPETTVSPIITKVGRRLIEFLVNTMGGSTTLSRHEMSKLINMSPNTIDTAFANLEDQGFVERIRPARVGKASSWKVTAAGHEWLRAHTGGPA